MPKRAKSTRWADLVTVGSRYRRSVHLERDAHAPEWLKGYVVTPLVRQVTGRVARGLDVESSTRAWSLTGPYGSGKSAFALFLSNLLEVPSSRRSGTARTLLKAKDPEISTLLFGRGGVLGAKNGLCPVLVTGERRPLDQVLLPALQRATKAHWTGKGGRPSVLGDLDAACTSAAKGERIPVRDVVQLFKEVAEKVARSRQPGCGLLVVLDEAGKALEFAAHAGGRGDIQLLQELAELASRSGDAPIVFVTTLHQAFERYAGRLGVAQRNEWAKVQGRFEDIPFRESADQLLRLIGEALQKEDLSEHVDRKEMRAVEEVAAQVRVAEQEASAHVASILKSCLPLHPVTALALGPLFRSKLAQNERSLFAFLGASEPYGFQEFLAADRPEGKTWPTYSIDELYDYLAHAWGSRLYGHEGRRWAQIDEAIRRLPHECGELDSRLIKTIGLLNLVGEGAGVVSSETLLCHATQAYTEAARKKVRTALRRLQQASVVVYRRYRQAYQLWDGSDLDLDALQRRAYEKADLRGTLIQRIARLVPPRPLVARRHLLKTGTLRFFEVSYADEAILDHDFGLPKQDGDGVLYFLVPTDEHAAEQVRTLLTERMTWSGLGKEYAPVVFALPQNGELLRALASEVGAWEWVLSNTPELQSDPIARRELDGRLADAERLLRGHLAGLLTGEEPCDWYSDGRRVEIPSARGLSAYLSTRCDETYKKAPVVLNELLNRRQLSSSAAAARRNLLEAMIEHTDQPMLGFSGNPPEVSMYRSLLATHGLHVAAEDKWAFCEPRSRKPGGLQHAWKELNAALEGTERKPRTVAEVYSRLKKPPYGLKDGVLPVLLVACLLHLEDDVAVYEEKRFVPRLTSAIIERLLKSPGKFQLQRYRIEGARADLFDRLIQMLVGKSARRRGQVIPVVSQLVRIVNGLSEYARSTRSISESARVVREVLLRAKEPGTLVFHQLPEACGCAPFDSKTNTSAKDVEEFIDRLRGALEELRQADARLAESLEMALANSFEAPAGGDELRRELAIRAKRVAPVIAEPRLKSFVLRLDDPGLSHNEWITSWATLLAGKPPDSWRDPDLEQLEVTLGLLARKFRTFEVLTFDQADGEPSGDRTLMRVSVAQPGHPERARVVSLQHKEKAAVDRLRDTIKEAARGHATDLSRDQIVAGLSLVVQDLLEELETEDDSRGMEAHR